MSNSRRGLPGDATPRPVQLAELILPAGGLLFTVYYLYTIRGLPVEASMSGYFLGTLVFLLCGILLVRFITRARLDGVEGGWRETLGEPGLLTRRLAAVALTIGYTASVSWLGFTLATFTFLLLSFAVLGVRSPWRLAGVPLILAAAGYLLFVAGLGADLPEGPVEHLVNAVARGGRG